MKWPPAIGGHFCVQLDAFKHLDNLIATELVKCNRLGELETVCHSERWQPVIGLGGMVFVRKTFFIMLLVALVSGGGAVAAQENQSGANPTPNNISALQVEAQQARKSCEDNLHYRRNYSCACIEANFPAARIKLGDSAPLHDLFSEVEKDCIDSASIETFQYEACLKSSRSSFPFLDPNGFGDYCTCVSKKSADKFIAAPFNSIKTITNYRNTSGAECGRLDLFKANSNQRPK